jgi:hypothetical protein
VSKAQGKKTTRTVAAQETTEEETINLAAPLDQLADDLLGPVEAVFDGPDDGDDDAEGDSGERTEGRAAGAARQAGVGDGRPVINVNLGLGKALKALGLAVSPVGGAKPKPPASKGDEAEGEEGGED